VRRLSFRQRLGALVLSAVAAGFLTLDLTGGSLHDAHSGARGLLGSLYRGTDSVFGPARRFVQGVPDAGQDSSRIAALQRENATLRAQLSANAQDATTSAELAKLQLAAGTLGSRVVAARVIAFGAGEGFDWTATINVGTSSGVNINQTVTSADGLIGRVLQAEASTSVVLLAADPKSGVGVRDLRNGELGVATGAGTAGFTVSPLDPVADLRVGDMLETGPAGSSTYAAGLQVGTITAVRTQDGAVTATVRPAMKPTEIDVVGVILSNTPPISQASK
jgi:rod shape-determining protein MreC